MNISTDRLLFGSDSSDTIKLTPHETLMLQAYRSLSQPERDMVDRSLGVAPEPGENTVVRKDVG